MRNELRDVSEDREERRRHQEHAAAGRVHGQHDEQREEHEEECHAEPYPVQPHTGKARVAELEQPSGRVHRPRQVFRNRELQTDAPAPVLRRSHHPRGVQRQGIVRVRARRLEERARPRSKGKKPLGVGEQTQKLGGWRTENQVSLCRPINSDG